MSLLFAWRSASTFVSGGWEDRCNLTAASWIECLVSYAETGICTA